MSCSKIFDNRVKLLDAVTVTDGVTQTSVWYPVDGWVGKRLWVDMDSAGAADIKIDIRLSPFHYQVLRDLASVTTEYYKEYAVSASFSTLTLSEFDDADVADLKRPAASFQLVAIGNTGTASTTFTGILEGLS